MSVPSTVEESPPQVGRWWRVFGWVAIAALLAGAFFLPQHVPLEWYPLNEPGTDILYLEIKCAADKDGFVGIFYNTTKGFNDLDSIRFPISPTEQTYTYTFPLPDAPLVAMRVDPVTKGGTLRIHHMRIVNRREEEIRRFDIDSFVPVQQIATIQPWDEEGWIITSTPDSGDARTHIEPFAPTTAVGMNGRNSQRCLLSTGYLAGMLVILMLAVVTAFWRPTSWDDFLRKIGLIAAIAVALAAIGNRGLIRNSIAYYGYAAPPPSGALRLEVRLQADVSHSSQLFWDVGHGMRESDSARRDYVFQPHPQTLRFPLPAKPLRALRFDPRDGAGIVKVTKIRIVDEANATRADIPLESLRPAHDIASLEISDGILTIAPSSGAIDPILEFSPAAVSAINDATVREPNRRP